MSNYIIAVWGRNGAGKTTVAVNLAAALAKQDRTVLLVSSNLWWPEIQLHFGQVVKEQCSLARLTQENCQGFELFSQYKKSPNLQLLTWPDDYNDLFGDYIGQVLAAKVYEQAKMLGFDYVIVDGAAAPNNALSALGLSLADLVLNVCHPAAADLFWFRAMAGFRAALGLDAKTRYIVNAADGSFDQADIYGKISPDFQLPLVEQIPGWANQGKLAWGNHRKYTSKMNNIVEAVMAKEGE